MSNYNFSMEEQKALNYVAVELDAGGIDNLQSAYIRAGELRESVSVCDPRIGENLCDLCREAGDYYGLTEDWFLEYDEEEIIDYILDNYTL